MRTPARDNPDQSVTGMAPAVKESARESDHVLPGTHRIVSHTVNSDYASTSSAAGTSVGSLIESVGKVSDETLIDAQLLGLGDSLAEISERLTELEIRLDVSESERWHARAVLANLPQPLIVTDPFGDVVLLSAAARKVFGIQASESPSHRSYGSLALLIPDPGLITLVRQVRSLHRRGVCRIIRTWVPTESGPAEFEIHLTCVCDRNDGNPSPWGVVIVFIPIAPHAPHERALRLPDGSSGQPDGALGQSLISQVQACANSLFLAQVEQKTPADRRRFIASLAAESAHLTRLAQNAQILAQIEAGEIHPPSTPTDLRHLLRSAGDIIGHNAILLNDAAGPVTASTPADERLLSHAVLHTLLAAQHAPAANGVAHLSLDTTPNQAHLRLTFLNIGGPNFAKHATPLVDDPSASHLPTHAARRHDLDLPLLRAIVETVHGGTVEACSLPPSLASPSGDALVLTFKRDQ